ncbi:hypothetical protein [Kocuria sabuli]|uniref:hypothetical protein n=1 Tax=Kocuria sabuli TaxID=3071448 RepID=UPI0034D7187F
MGLVEILDRVTMQVFVRRDCLVIAATVQRHVDGVTQGPPLGRVQPMDRTALCRSNGDLPQWVGRRWRNRFAAERTTAVKGIRTRRSGTVVPGVDVLGAVVHDT